MQQPGRQWRLIAVRLETSLCDHPRSCDSWVKIVVDWWQWKEVWSTSRLRFPDSWPGQLLGLYLDYLAAGLLSPGVWSWGDASHLATPHSRVQPRSSGRSRHTGQGWVLVIIITSSSVTATVKCPTLSMVWCGVKSLIKPEMLRVRSVVNLNIRKLAVVCVLLLGHCRRPAHWAQPGLSLQL